jgi:hypothetical protein
MSNQMNPLAMIAIAPSMGNKSDSKSSSWFDAMAQAWGETLDAQAGKIETMSAELSNGDDKPATITALSAEAMKMGFLSNSSHSSLQSVGDGLSTMARKS